MHGQAEHQRARLRWDHSQARRFRDHGAVRAVAAEDGGQGARPAVLLARHAGDAQAAPQPQPGVADRLGGEQGTAEAALHVHGAAAVDPAVPQHRVPGRRRPDGLIADGGHIDVAVEQQVAADAVCRGPDRSLADPADHTERLVAFDLVTPVRMTGELVQVDRPDVGLEALGRQPLGHAPLGRGLVPVQARDRDQLTQERHEAVEVERLQRRALDRAELAHPCLSPGRAGPAA